MRIVQIHPMAQREEERQAALRKIHRACLRLLELHRSEQPGTARGR